ncbi:MAG: hypothetical protein P8Z68_08740, partial [Kineosporiaceae bacterium]
MTGHLQTVGEVTERILRGQVLVLAADAAVLRMLPPGRWIGGSVPYLEGVPGSVDPSGLVHVMQLPPDLPGVSVQVYDVTRIRDVYADLSGEDFGVIAIPAASPTHAEFALHAPGYRGFEVRPLVGWVAGPHLDGSDAGRASVFAGSTGQEIIDGAVVLRGRLPQGRVATVGVVNIFEQGDGEVIGFPRDGFDVDTAIIDGVERNFADFVQEKGLDTRLPLVADYYGVQVNVSFRAVNPIGREVRFYSPVFAGLVYRHAREIGDYGAELAARSPRDGT